MSRFWRNFLCICVGLFSGYIGVLIIFIFWPLLYPQSLHGPSPGEDAGVAAIATFFTLFFVAGLLLCRKFTKRFMRDKGDITVLFR